MLNIQIPSPCPMRKEQMTPVAGGFYCSDCSKVVVDFSAMSDAQIRQYFEQKAGQKTCGIFRNEQLQPKRNFSFEVVRFAAALLLVFGAFLFQSCDSNPSTHTTGDTIMPATTRHDSTTTGDSIYINETKQQLDSAHMADSVAHAQSLHDTVGMIVPKTGR